MTLPTTFRSLIAYSLVLCVSVSGCASSGAISQTAVESPSVVASSSDPTSIEVHPPLTGPIASSLAADLGSGDQGRVTSQLVLPSAGTAVDPAAYAQLQALGPIATDDASFKQLSDTLAQVYAKVGQAQQDWTLILEWNGNRWQLADTLAGRQDLAQHEAPSETAAASTETSATTG